MRFSGENIKNQQFSASFRGYDKDEVHLFLDKLADEYEMMDKELEALKKENELNIHSLNEYKKNEKKLQDTLLRAQESSVKAVDSAKRQSSLMIKEAENKSALMINSARQSADEIRSNLIRLREEKKLIVARLKAFINTQSRLLDFEIGGNDERKTITTKPKDTKAEISVPGIQEIDVDGILNKLD